MWGLLMARQDARRSLIGIVAAVLLVSLVPIGYAMTNRDKANVSPRLTLPGEGPLPGGKRVELDTLATQAPFRVYLPAAELASDDTAREVWVRGGEDPEVLIDYSSGVRLTERPNDRTIAAIDYYEQQISEGVTGEVRKVVGLDAFVVSQTDEGDLGSVTFEWQGLIVTVIGHGDFSDSDLVTVAASIIEQGRSTR